MNNQRIITYFRLNEEEKRRIYFESGGMAILKDKTFAAGYAHLAILQDDGTVLALGNNSRGQCDVGAWSDIIKVAAGDFHTVGLRRDGSVMAVGDNEYGQCNVSDWKNVKEIYADKALTVGVQNDGKILLAQMNGTTKHQLPPVVDKDSDIFVTPTDEDNFYFSVENSGIRIWDYKGSGKSVVIPRQIQGNPVQIIAHLAFESAEFEEIILPDTLTTIAASAFIDCKNLKQIRIPDNVSVIENYAFWSCSSLEEVALPENLTFIGSRAFYACPRLKHVYLPKAAANRLKIDFKKCFMDVNVITMDAPPSTLR